MPEDERQQLLRQLLGGPVHSFSDWPIRELPASPGVYTVWEAVRLIYVGVAGRNGASGLRGRLSSHASGRRSGDQFCLYICDRFVLRTLSAEQIRGIAEGSLSLDVITRVYIRSHLTFRWVAVATAKEALSMERGIRAGGLECGAPVLNPLNG